MTVKYCVLCNNNPTQKRRYGGQGLADGLDCPICNRPACRFHLSTVRWRWRATGEADEALVCKECQRSYAHRTWDTYNRDWIT